ncbi:MAG: ankyrin repeat domain-containing protein [Alphaproteobacteria bacterium]|nr:ankyrin repeat domain-containing protein [Alphaproteobacteria bacterium]
MTTRRAILISILMIPGAAIAMGDTGMELHEAAAANNANRLSGLIASGHDIGARDKQERTPLLIATRANAIDAARVLIAAGADVNAKDRIADTPFLYAGAEGRLEILKLILATGKANLKDTNRYGGNALIPACHHGHPETVRELLKTEIDVDHVNRLGWTALLETIILSDGGPTHQDIMAQLIAAGADVNFADLDGVTPLAHARQRNYTEMLEMLERAGAE